MAEPTITRDQIRRLQTLWGQYARREMSNVSRADRLVWASEQCKRTILSFNDLTLREASMLINILQGAMGIAETNPAARQRRYRSRIKDRDQAHAAGTEGRRGDVRKVSFATAEDLAMIDTRLGEMGWSRVRLDAFLASPSSPLGRRSNPQIRTLADVNRVLWALKRIAAKKVGSEVQS